MAEVGGRALEALVDGLRGPGPLLLHLLAAWKAGCPRSGFRLMPGGHLTEGQS